MTAPANTTAIAPDESKAALRTALVRYGRIPEVERFPVVAAEAFSRGEQVVVRTHRGLELGELLESVPAASTINELPELLAEPCLLRRAAEEDGAHRQAQWDRAEAAFQEWTARIVEWNLELELIDLEWTLDDQKLVLYVLNERGPESTKLALHAAAAGLGVVEVQPVNAEGLVQLPAAGGGCGSGGCGSGGCHSH